VFPQLKGVEVSDKVAEFDAPRSARGSHGGSTRRELYACIFKNAIEGGSQLAM